jgi:hypothetical protein
LEDVKGFRRLKGTATCPRWWPSFGLVISGSA